MDVGDRWSLRAGSWELGAGSWTREVLVMSMSMSGMSVRCGRALCLLLSEVQQRTRDRKMSCGFVTVRSMRGYGWGICFCGKTGDGHLGLLMPFSELEQIEH